MLFGRKSASEVAAEAAGTAGPSQVSTPTAVRTEAAPLVNKQLGQLLIDEGLITSSQLEKALEEQGRTKAFLGQILVKQGSVTQSAVSSCLVKQCKIPHLNLLDYEITSDVMALLPEEVCKKYHLLPIDKLGRILTVAMVDPLDNEALEVIRQHCGDLKIKPILCNWEHYEVVAGKLWGQGGERKGGERHLTTESLGLGRSMPQPKAADRTPTPAPPAPSLSESSMNAARAVAANTAPGISAKDLSLAMRDAMQDVVKALATQPVREATPGATGEEISAAIRSAMQEAVQSLASTVQPQAQPVTQDFGALGAMLRESMQDAVATMAKEMRPVPVLQPQADSSAAPAPDLGALAAMMRESVQEAVSSVAREMRSAMPAPVANTNAPSGGISPEQMAHVIQDSVGNAMQESMALLVTQLKAMNPRRDDSASAEALAAAVRDSVREAIESTVHVQNAQGERLAQIAEATLQSVQQNAQALEASAVGKQVEQDLLRVPQGRHASVSAFRGGASGTMDNDHKVTEALQSNRPAENMTFDNFVPGSMNAFTFRIGQEVAKNPGGDFNPYFLFGHVGAGKTHLISAIGNQILRERPLARVGYVSASHFARCLKEAMADNALESFRENYAHWDVLILDDIQFMAGRVEAQEEFFHIFNALHAQGRQIIIASDKAPDRLGMLEQRLISRFASGIVAELKAPEWEARMAILRHQVQQAGVMVPEPVLSLIAMRVADDVRKMCGSLRKVIAFAQLGGRDLTCELAEEILSHLGSEVAA